MRKEIVIYGAGGLGREVLALIRQSGVWQPVGLIDDYIEEGTVINGIPVLGGLASIKDRTDLHIVIAVGDPLTKSNIALQLNPELSYPTLIHPSALIMDPERVRLGKGCIISAGVIITTDVLVGDHVLVNLNSTIGHDTVVGSYSSIMPGVNIAGQVKIGEKVLLGSGVNVMNKVTIGNAARVGMGAVVLKEVGECQTVAGVPARPIGSKK